MLAHKYRIERVVGSGGMGIVFAVTNLLTDRPLAIKWLAHSPAESDALRRFRREAKIAGRIRHPHVVDVHDIHLQEDGSFLVMELLEGESLAERLKRSGPIPAVATCQIILPCMSGVAAAHAAHVIHRDLKPDNIFLCRRTGEERDHPKLLDFGISRMRPPPGAPHTTETRAGTLLGTPAYMAPEQLLAVPCDARTDVYALGVTMYEMLAGARAFEGTTYAALTAKIIHGEVLPLAERAPNVPEALAAIVMRAMHRKAEERYPDVDALAGSIRDWLRSVDAGPAIAPVPVAPRRNRAVPIAVAALTAVAGALGAFGLHSSESRREPEPIAPASEATEPAPGPVSAPVAPVALPPVEEPMRKPDAAVLERAEVVEPPNDAPRSETRTRPRRESNRRRADLPAPAKPPPDDSTPAEGPIPKPMVRIDGI